MDKEIKVLGFLVRVQFLSRVHKGSSHLQEVLKFTFHISTISNSVLSNMEFSDEASEDLVPSISANTGPAVLLLLTLEGFGQHHGKLVLEGLFSALSDGGLLGQLLDSSVVHLVGEVLEGVLVVGVELELSVGLVGQSFPVPVGDLLDGGLGVVDGDLVESAEDLHESLLGG